MAASLTSALWNDVVSLGGALILVAIAWLLGSGLLQRLRITPSIPVERHLAAAGLGLGVLSLTAFLVGVAGAFSHKALNVALFLPAVLALLLRRPGPSNSQAPSPRVPPWAVAIAGIAALLLLAQLPAVVSPMVDYDGLAYHVGAPKRWLEMGCIAALPTHLHTFWPMAQEMLNGLLLATFGDGACKPLTWVFAALGAASTYALGRRLAGPAAGVVAAAFLVLYAGAQSINSTSVEISLAFYVVLSALLLAMRAGAEERDRKTCLFLAAVMAGFACATKLNGLFCLAFLITGLVAVERGSAISRFKPALAFATLALLPAIPWYVRTWWLTGNPVFPFAYGLFGGRNWSAETARSLSLYFHTFNLPGDDVAARMAVVKRHLLKLSGLTVVGLAIAGSPRWVRGFVLVAGAFAIGQTTLSDNARFLLPAIPFAGIAMGYWLSRLAEWRKACGWLAAVGFATLAAMPVIQAARQIPPVVWGGESREAFIERYVNNRPAFEWANAHLPQGARVLYGPDNRTYYLQRDVFWSSAVYQQDIPYDSPERFRQALRENGIQYLILNRDLYRDSAIDFETRIGWRRDEKKRLLEAAATGRLLFSASDVDVYALP